MNLETTGKPFGELMLALFGVIFQLKWDSPERFAYVVNLFYRKHIYLLAVTAL